jgi:hypothetical protein
VARTLALLAAVVSLVPWFGLVDLATVFQLGDPGFRDAFLLNTGWGLLYGVLVPVNLVMFAFRPGWRVLLAQLAVVAAAILVAGVATGDGGEVVVALVVGAVTAALAGLTRTTSTQARAARSGDPVLLVLSVVGLIGAVGYAVKLVRVAGDPADDITNGLPHLPIQAAVVLAIAGMAAVSTLAARRSAPGWRASAVAPVACAIWLGVVSALEPDLLGSLGRAGGVAALLWGVVLGVRVLAGARVRGAVESARA